MTGVESCSLSCVHLRAPFRAGARPDRLRAHLLLPELCVLRAGPVPGTGTHRFDHLPELVRKLGQRVLELVTGNSLT